MLARQGTWLLEQGRQASSIPVDSRSLSMDYTKTALDLSKLRVLLTAITDRRFPFGPKPDAESSLNLGCAVIERRGECGRGNFGVGFGGDLVGVGVVVEQFGVSTPADSDVELLLRVVGAESLLKDIEEEPGPQCTVRAVMQSVADGITSGVR